MTSAPSASNSKPVNPCKLPRSGARRQIRRTPPISKNRPKTSKTPMSK